MEKILKDNKLYNNITTDTIQKLQEKGFIKKLEKKEILFHEKSELGKVYILIEGKATIYKHAENGERKVVFILGSGDILNEILIESQFTSVGCEAFEKCTILEYSSMDFLDIMKNDFELTKNYISYMEKRTRRLYRQVKNAMSIKIEKKLAAKLYRISKEYGVLEDEWTKLNINITITYLSDMLGCPRESVSRSFKILENEGLVKSDNKTIYIKAKEIASYFKGR